MRSVSGPPGCGKILDGICEQVSQRVQLDCHYGTGFYEPYYVWFLHNMLCRVVLAAWGRNSEAARVLRLNCARQRKEKTTSGA